MRNIEKLIYILWALILHICCTFYLTDAVAQQFPLTNNVTFGREAKGWLTHAPYRARKTQNIDQQKKDEQNEVEKSDDEKGENFKNMDKVNQVETSEVEKSEDEKSEDEKISDDVQTFEKVDSVDGNSEND